MTALTELLEEDDSNVYVQMRRASGMRQVDVATKASATGLAKVPRSLVHELEHGTRKEIGARKLYAIASALGVRMETLLKLPPLPRQPAALATPEPELADLLAAQRVYGWPDEDVKMLMQVHFRGQRPQSVDAWWFIYESIRRAVTK